MTRKQALRIGSQVIMGKIKPLPYWQVERNIAMLQGEAWKKTPLQVKAIAMYEKLQEAAQILEDIEKGER